MVYLSDMNYLQGLNEKQKEAILQKDGPVLIIAGAGAGKTKTITHRILHVYQQSRKRNARQGRKDYCGR